MAHNNVLSVVYIEFNYSWAHFFGTNGCIQRKKKRGANKKNDAAKVIQLQLQLQ